MGRKDTVMPDPLLKKHSIKVWTFRENTQKLHNDNLCLFQVVALHLLGNEGFEEESSNLFILLLQKFGGTDPANFRGVCMESIEAVEDIVQKIIYCTTFTL